MNEFSAAEASVSMCDESNPSSASLKWLFNQVAVLVHQERCVGVGISLKKLKIETKIKKKFRIRIMKPIIATFSIRASVFGRRRKEEGGGRK